MTDWTRLEKGADLSHYQEKPDFGALAEAGIKFVIIKASQGLRPDQHFEWNRNEAARRNMLWLPYPFLTPGDDDRVMHKFISVIGTGVKLPVALDWEMAGTLPGVVEWWMDLCEETFGRPGLAYYGMDPPGRISPRIAAWPRWFPQYPATRTSDPRLPPWNGGAVPNDWRSEWLVWQWTGNGRLPGINTPIDLNRLACSFDVFKQWHATGEFPVLQSDTVGSLIPVGMLHLHSVGDAVVLLQQRLVALGFQVVIDGRYGPQTEWAIRSYQKQQGLAADGISGPATIGKLNSRTQP